MRSTQLRRSPEEGSPRSRFATVTVSATPAQVATPSLPGARPSDLDPLRGLMGYVTSLQQATAEMKFAGSQLCAGSQLLIRAMEIAVASASHSYGPRDFQFLAQDIGDLRHELLLVANSKLDNRFVFAGDNTDVMPFGEQGIYRGNGVERYAQAGPGLRLAVSLAGNEIFGESSENVNIFSVLATLQVALENSVSLVATEVLSDLDTAIDQLTAGRSFFNERITQAGALIQGLQQQIQSLNGTRAEPSTPASPTAARPSSGWPANPFEYFYRS